jgi:ribose transport system substrate-binding protein
MRYRALEALATCVFIIAGTLCSAAADKQYKVYLSNNFVGNDWRQQMLRSADVAARKPPLAGRVALTINNAENTVQAQINALNNIIREKPDAILIDASSGEALNPTIERACADGIVVISFDQVVTADCAYKLQSNFDSMGYNQTAWMVATLGGKGNVLIDRGLAGAPAAPLRVRPRCRESCSPTGRRGRRPSSSATPTTGTSRTPASMRSTL